MNNYNTTRKFQVYFFVSLTVSFLIVTINKRHVWLFLFPSTKNKNLSFFTQNINNALTNITAWTLPKDQHKLLLSTRPGPVAATSHSAVPCLNVLHPAGSYQPYVADLSPTSEPTMKQEAAQQLCKSIPSERNKTDFVSSLSFYYAMSYLTASSDVLYTYPAPGFSMVIDQRNTAC
jgi:hypothetical protein